MKSIVTLLFIGSIFFVVGCTKEPRLQSTHIDSLNTGGSMASGNSGDNTLPGDSMAYDVDSIKNSK